MNKLCTYTVLLVCFLSLKGKGQNLVPNSSFEYFTDCPTGGQFYKIVPWCGLGGGEDSYNVCHPIQGGVNIPYGGQGFQYARTGNGMGNFYVMRIGSGTTDNREYIHVPLIKPLQAGKRYCGTMYLNLYSDTKFTTDKVGMYFSTAPYTCNQAMPFPQNIAPLNVTPQIANAPGNFITDTLNWMEVCGIFTAAGNEGYLTIGNFANDASTNTISVNPPALSTVILFFIDDVSVEEIIQARTYNDTTICINDSIKLAPLDSTEFAEYTWQPATGLSCTNCANPKASPQVTTTYTLTKKQCKVTTSDAITITVKPDCNLKSQLHIPNVFTPNGDSINDVFTVKLHPGSTLKHFAIFNRWGNKITNNNTTVIWTGRNTAGEPCTDGVYYYVLSYTDPEGKEESLRGYISLFR